MSGILKGNFVTKKSVSPTPQKDRLEDRFEREALKRLGGSIAFVSKQRVIWGIEDAPQGQATAADGRDAPKRK